MRWYNIGKYKRKDSRVVIVVFDLHGVVDYDASHKNWIENSMTKLYRVVLKS